MNSSVNWDLFGASTAHITNLKRRQARARHYARANRISLNTAEQIDQKIRRLLDAAMTELVNAVRKL